MNTEATLLGLARRAGSYTGKIVRAAKACKTQVHTISSAAREAGQVFRAEMSGKEVVTKCDYRCSKCGQCWEDQEGTPNERLMPDHEALCPNCSTLMKPYRTTTFEVKKGTV